MDPSLPVPIAGRYLLYPPPQESGIRDQWRPLAYLFRTVEADGPQCRRYQALSYWGSGGAWNGSVDWVKGGANGVSLQET